MSEESRAERRKISEQYKGDPQGYEKAMIAYDQRQQEKIDKYYREINQPNPLTKQTNFSSKPRMSKEKRIAILKSLTPATRMAVLSAVMEKKQQRHQSQPQIEPAEYKESMHDQGEQESLEIAKQQAEALINRLMATK